MEVAILNSKSKSNLNLLLAIAKKLGVNTKRLSNEEIEDIGLSKAIKEGRTSEYIDTELFIEKLRK